jgi:hypothetical protein
MVKYVSWTFLVYFGSFVCGLNLEFIQIQTQPLAFKPHLIPKVLNPFLGRPFLKSVADPFNSPAQQPNQPTSSTLMPRPCFSRCRVGPTRQPPRILSFIPFLLRFYPAAGQPSRIAQGRAMGWPRLPGSPHAEGRCMRAGSESTAGEVKTLLPLTARIRGETERRPRAPPTPPGERPGVRGAIQPRLPAASLQKGARQANRERQATNPIGVFSSSSPSFAPGEEGKGTTPRRAGGGRT